ncbi:thioredoxin family protein [Hymenobacter cheonanensis]|uniref:thioredoxin family protein n=1 Tax=Hymenobacter sp. CA2-7 TaxID=3063993 RepID=UPI0027127052|nr:thioredoxin family protein [Hymenobacter sp. CA2-7]MDO7886217.1 thioredoxin family protein [Hymenobacter sp. CA2-7]
MRTYLLSGLAAALLAAAPALAQSGGGASQTTPALTWNTSLPTALAQAQASRKPVLAVFSGSDWCKPCMQLKQEVFDQPEFRSYAQDKFVLARFDFPRSKKNALPKDQTRLSEEAAAQLNKEGAFPAVVLLSPEGKVLARTGYRPGGATAYDAYLDQLLAKK